MTTLHIECKLFDPIRISTATRAERFIVDTWYSTGLISRSLLGSLPGVETAGSGHLLLSSGMRIECKKIKIGVQIKNIRATPIEFFVVDDGPAPLLLGSDFIQLLFSMGVHTHTGAGSGGSEGITIDAPGKFDPGSVGIRLMPTKKTIDALQLERFLRSIRAIHNVGVLAETGLHQHEDWPRQNKTDAKTRAVRETIEKDRSLSDENTLTISWVENGSIWLSLKSGAGAALSWIAQIFEKSMDARLRATMASATSMEEEAAIKRMTRDEIARAKNWEQKRYSAKHIREAREEWRKTVLGEIDFKKKLAERITDPVVRKEAEAEVEKALQELVESEFMPLIEHLPTISPDVKDALPAKNHTADHEDDTPEDDGPRI